MGLGPAVGPYPGGGAGVKAINTLILSSFLCCPKPLTAPEASPGTAHSGREVWDGGIWTQGAPTSWGSPSCGPTQGVRGDRSGKDDGSGGKRPGWVCRQGICGGQCVWSPWGAHQCGNRP